MVIHKIIIFLIFIFILIIFNYLFWIRISQINLFKRWNLIICFGSHFENAFILSIKLFSKLFRIKFHLLINIFHVFFSFGKLTVYQEFKGVFVRILTKHFPPLVKSNAIGPITTPEIFFNCFDLYAFSYFNNQI